MSLVLLFLVAVAGGTTFTCLASGGANASGVALVSRTRTYQVTGGASVAGAALVMRSKSYTVSGGTTIGGAATLLTVTVPTATGGMVSDGTAPIATLRAWSASGGTTSNGISETIFSRSYQYEPDGGYVFGGTSFLAILKQPEMSGGMLSSNALAITALNLASPIGRIAPSAYIGTASSFSYLGPRIPSRRPPAKPKIRGYAWRGRLPMPVGEWLANVHLNTPTLTYAYMPEACGISILPNATLVVSKAIKNGVRLAAGGRADAEWDDIIRKLIREDEELLVLLR